MREYQLYINGAFQESTSKETFDSLNPFNQEIVARVSRANVVDTKEAITAARNAFDTSDWKRISGNERAAMLKAVADKIKERKNELEILEIEDSGSTLRKAKEDIFLSGKNMNVFSQYAVMDFNESLDRVSKAGFSKNYLYREPIGVVAAIIPWNFPLKMAIWKLGPALAAGNTVVLKPSEVTPCTAMELAKIFDEVGFPKGVVNIIPGFGEDVGEELAKNPLVDKVTFTGSTAIGKRVMSLASVNLKKCTLECGGKSANIVLDDADLEMAIDGAMYAIFYHQGQCCEAGSRLLLSEKIHDEFLSKLVEKTKKLKLGNPKDNTTEIGPLVSKKQQERVLSYIAQGKQSGAKIEIGGNIPSNSELQQGFFVEPTIFSSVNNKSTIAQEEIFGPVLSVIKFKTEQEAVQLANGSIYGLGAGVWSKDAEKAMSVAKQLRAGTVWINEWHLLSEHAPFGGYKQSGIGREFGMDGMKEYFETKHLHVDEVGERSKKFWYDTVVPKK
ncbi:MAG: aldehyde dehydrogenase family protein [Ignavibacteria bacterium]|nr:aldehyde dehydrogenase family protein [Ignavibacteria bacterium]